MDIDLVSSDYLFHGNGPGRNRLQFTNEQVSNIYIQKT